MPIATSPVNAPSGAAAQFCAPQATVDPSSVSATAGIAG